MRYLTEQEKKIDWLISGEYFESNCFMNKLHAKYFKLYQMEEEEWKKNLSQRRTKEMISDQSCSWIVLLLSFQFMPFLKARKTNIFISENMDS